MGLWYNRSLDLEQTQMGHYSFKPLINCRTIGQKQVEVRITQLQVVYQECHTAHGLGAAYIRHASRET